jgi:hypothetical protein
MAMQMCFPQAGFLNYLELISESHQRLASAPLSPLLARILLTSDGSGEPTKAAGNLIQLLIARRATLQAAFDTALAADELRRYQKFAKPGQPSPHIVQLRQKQAAARQASSQSKQSLIKAAAAFVRDAGIEVPLQVALELYITRWIDINVPKEFVPAT